MINKQVIKDIILIILIATTAGLISNFVSSNSLPLIRSKPSIGDKDVENKGISYIHPDEAYKLYLKKEAIFLDARPLSEFNKCSIMNALPLPYYNFDEAYPKIKNNLIGKKIVTYCDGEQCLLSLKLARELNKKGHKNIYVLLGGLPNWLSNKYPITSNENFNNFFPKDYFDLPQKSCN